MPPRNTYDLDNWQTRTTESKIRLENKTAGHNKFWEIHVDWVGKKYRTYWGKIGTSGQPGRWKVAKYKVEERRRRYLFDEVFKLLRSKEKRAISQQ